MLRKTLGGRYSILSRLGAGGFGETYLAEDIQLPDHHCCVVKHLKPQSTEPEVLNIARRLFESEAKVLHRLGTHDQIPRLLANFEEDQEFYLVQELVEGHGLDRELSPGKKWSEAQVIDFLQDLLLTLGFVHQQKVIHRDIKPENLIRRQHDSKLVLIDFGAVKQIYTQIITESKRAKSTITIGTMGYMPCEQANGHPQISSDLYAVGIIAIQALTGLDPDYIPKNPHSLELEWSHLVDVSLGLVKIIDKMVRYDFRQRYPSADSILNDLANLGISADHTVPELQPVISNFNHQTHNQNLATNIESGTTHQPTEITTTQNQNLEAPVEVIGSQPTEILSNDRDLNLVPDKTSVPPTEIARPQKVIESVSQPINPVKHVKHKVTIGGAIALLIIVIVGFGKHLQSNMGTNMQNVSVNPPKLDQELQADRLLQQGKVLEQINGKIKSGSKLQDIETLALKIPETSPLRNRMKAAIAKYQQRWQQDQLAFNEASKAFKAKNWEKALSATKKINTSYWQRETKWIVDQANAEIAAALVPPPPVVTSTPEVSAPTYNGNSGNSNNNSYTPPAPTYVEPPPEKFAIPEAQ